MGIGLPRNVALKSLSNNKYLRFTIEDVTDHGLLQFSGNEFLSLYERFELEMSHTKFGLYNIRSSYNHKYLVPESSVSPLLLASANETDEDHHSKWSSTLFEIIIDDSGDDNLDAGCIIVQLRHVHHGQYATASLPDGTADTEQQETSALSPEWIDDVGKKAPPVTLVLNGPREGATPQNQKFLLVDLGSFFVLPTVVAFKTVATSGQYLRARTIEGRPHLELGSNDLRDPAVVNEVHQFSDGSVLIKSKHVNKVWRSGGREGIVTDYDLEGEGEEKGDNEVKFIPVKIGNNLVALRNAATGKYCTSYAAEEGKPKCLNDVVDDAVSILKDAVFEVKIF